MGHIVKTPAGTFRANWRDATGRQKAKTFKTRKDAAAFLAETESALTRGTYVDPRAGRIRFEDFAARWLVSRSVEARTAERTLSLLRTHVLPRWADWPIGRIDYLSVQQWVASLGKSLAPATVAKCYGVLSTVLQTAVRARLIAHNPSEGVRVPGRSGRGEEPRATAIGREEFFAKLLPALPVEHRAIVCTAAGAGLRWGECVGLVWGRADLDALRVYVRQVAVETPSAVTMKPYPKTKAGIRDVPIPAFLVKALTAHRARLDNDPAPNDLVFTSEAGTPLRRSNFRRRVWVPALQRAGLPGTLRFHDLRHSYATWLVSDGLPVNVVQRVLGHEQASTTLNRYTHTPSDYLDRVRDVLDAAADDPLTLDLPDREEGDDDGGAASPVAA